MKLGVLALAEPEFGGTYQYTLSMLQALRYTTGFEVTLYGDPNNPDFAGMGYPIAPFAETRAQQLASIAAHRLETRQGDGTAQGSELADALIKAVPVPI